MERLDQFEFPLPHIKLDIEEINIETSGVYDGSFVIRNTGGSELEGYITSNSRGITFSPSRFKGNNVEISYSFVVDFYKLGDEIKTSALVISNGGEAVIPISVKIIAPAIFTRDGQKISSLGDYMRLAKESPVTARQMFNQWDFSVWLSNMGFPHMELYEHFTTDPNKERAVDNFLIINNLKPKSEVTIEAKRISLTVKPNSADPVTGAVVFRRSTWGYADVKLTVKQGASWLKLNKDRLVGSDFNDEDRAEMYFIAMPELIAGSFDSARIEAESESGFIGEIHIDATKAKPITVYAGRPSLNYDDRGVLEITNNTGKDLMFEIYSGDSFVKFEGRRHFIGEYAEITFQIKMSALQIAQLSFRKQAFVKTQIFVKVISTDIDYKKVLELSVGGF